MYTTFSRILKLLSIGMKLPIMQFNTAFPSLTKGLRAAGVKSRFPHISSVYLKEDIGMSICLKDTLKCSSQLHRPM